MSPDLISKFEEWRGIFFAQTRYSHENLEFLEILKTVCLDEEVWNKANNQPEVMFSLQKYFEILTSDSQIATGTEKLSSESKTFGTIGDFGLPVSREVLAAIWGVETRYGEIKGDHPVLDALATHAATNARRREFFEYNLISALQILQDGMVRPDQLKGSWAGAMGHTQFMPSVYLEYGIDVRHRGEVDIWGDDPLDALASTANYLHKHGWEECLPVLSEVSVPQGVDFMKLNNGHESTVSDWQKEGMEFVNREVPLNANAEIISPAGKDGPKFALFCNFKSILAYNPSRSYALAVGYLANCLTSKQTLVSSWPPTETYLTRSELKKVQSYLVGQGYDTGGIDGLTGTKTIKSIQHYQKSRGWVPDGFPDRQLYQAVVSD